MVDGCVSSVASVTSGVPQGSVLGPLLFLMYINDLPSCIKHSTTRLFADDCVLYRWITSRRDRSKLQQDLDALLIWEQRWLMEFNPSKCQVISFTNKQSPIPPTYSIREHVLEVVDSGNYLDVHLDSKLSFNTHIDAVTKKANSVKAFLSRNLSRGTRNIKAASFKTYIRPIVEYASVCWDPYTSQNIDRVEKVQRRSARYVMGDYDYTSSVTSMLEYLQWPSLQSRRLRSRLTMLYKIRFGLVDINWKSYWTSPTTPRVSSEVIAAPSFYTLNCSLDVFKYSFFPRTCRDWNSLLTDPACYPRSTPSSQR